MRLGQTVRLVVAAACGGAWFAVLPLALDATGCGGSSEVKDASVDQTVVDVGVDTGPDVKDAGCPIMTDLFALDFGDASFPADSGLDGSISVCWGCIKTKCMASVAECNNNCECKKAVSEFLTCVEKNGLQTSCAAPLLTFDPNFALSFGGCALSQCNGPCPIPVLDGGSDSGPKDSGGGG